MDEAAKALTQGAVHVLSNDNIAIVVMFLCLCGSGFVNIWLLRWLFRFLISLKDVLSELKEQIVKLNERIDHV